MTKASRGRDELADRLGAERSLRGAETGSSGSNGEPPSASLEIGEAAKVGDFTIRPTAVDKLRSGSGSTTYRATLTIKNEGSESDSPFCGGSNAQLIDAEGRFFDGDSHPEQVDFKLPNDARPAVLALAADVLSDSDDAETWEIP